MDRPKHVLQWHITHRCNLRCTHCYQEEYAKTCSSVELRRIFSQYTAFCDAKGFRGHINFTGGEPLLSEELFPLMTLCEEHGFTFGILTNGTLITPEIAEKLSRYKRLSFVQISIDGTEQTHDSIRGKGNFAKAFEGIRLLRAVGIQTMVSFTCHKGNLRELRKVISICRKNRVDRFWSDRLIPIGSNTEDILSTAEFREYVRILTAEHDRKPIFSRMQVHLNRALQFCEGGDCFYSCSAGISLLTVLADGTLLPCRRLPIPIGNCLERDMTELFDSSPLIAELNRMEIPRECYPCPHANKCRGGAKCLSYAVSGDYNVRDINCYLRYRKEQS